MAPTTRIVSPVGQTDEAKTPTSTVSVSGTDVALVAANPGRVALYISNDHATQVVYLAFGATAEVNKGIRLGPASGLPLKITEYTGAVRAIASGSTTPVLITEV